MKEINLHRWGAWYDRQLREGGSPRRTAKCSMGNLVTNSGDSIDKIAALSDDEEMERVHEAFLNLHRSAQLVLVAHYRDWARGERERPQPFAKGLVEACVEALKRQL